MRCGECGNEIVERSMYCPRCASKLDWQSVSDAGDPNDSNADFLDVSIGRVLRSYSPNMYPYLLDKPSPDLEWAFHDTTLFIGANAIALVPMSKGLKSADYLNLASRLVGTGGGFVFGLPIAAIAAAVEQISTSRQTESNEVVKLLFDAGSLLLMPRSMCKGYLFHHKEKGFFARQRDTVRFVGKLLHTKGILSGFFSLDLDSENELKQIQDAGYVIEDDPVLYQQEVFFKRTLPGDPAGSWMTADVILRQMQGKPIL